MRRYDDKPKLICTDKKSSPYGLSGALLPAVRPRAGKCQFSLPHIFHQIYFRTNWKYFRSNFQYFPAFSVRGEGYFGKIKELL